MRIAYKKIAQVSVTKFLAGAVLVLGLASCTEDPNSPGVEYMPDMYRAVGYEAYLKKYDIDSAEFFERNLEKLGYEEASDSTKLELIEEVKEIYAVFNGGLVTRKPVEGTVADGKKPFTIERGARTPEDRALAKAVKMPIPYTEVSLTEGQSYYEIFCDHCHGSKGKGDGAMVKKELFLKPPAYDAGTTKDLEAGEIYFTIFYGKGMMGPHASQITEEKRWKIVQYVQTLQGKSAEDLINGKMKMEPAVVDTTVVDSL